MKFGAVNHYKNRIEDEIRWLKSKAFDYIDMTFEPVFSSSINPGPIKEALAETGLDVIGHISPFLPLAFPLKSIRKPAWEELIHYADIFGDIGAGYVTLHPSLNMPLVDMEDKFKYNSMMIEKADQIIRDRGMVLIVENFLSPFDTPESFRRLLEGSDGVKVHVDVGHCNLSGEKNLTESFFKYFGDRIVHLHFSDNSGKADEHLPIGSGNINWEEISEILLRYGYDSTITLEVFTSDRNDLVDSKEKAAEIINKIKNR